jgi:hypothetical protein
MKVGRGNIATRRAQTTAARKERLEVSFCDAKAAQPRENSVGVELIHSQRKVQGNPDRYARQEQREPDPQPRVAALQTTKRQVLRIRTGRAAASVRPPSSVCFHKVSFAIRTEVDARRISAQRFLHPAAAPEIEVRCCPKLSA